MVEVLQKQEQTDETAGKVSELERVVAEKEAEIVRLTQTNGELEKRANAYSGSLTNAIARYKEAVIRANPDVIEELIKGETIVSIDESLARGKDLVSKVRQGVEAAISMTKVPAGAPERTPPDLSALSPREKIKYALVKK